MRALARRVCARTLAAAATRGLARAALARTATRALATGAADAVKKTALYDLHVSLGGKMVPFAGYYLPVKYKDGDIESHLHCRKAASLFDVSHMGQLRIHGADRLKFLETLVPSDLFALKANQTRLSVLTNESGGIIDDCMITNTQTPAQYTYMVVNAGCKDKDIAHMRARLIDFNAKNKSDVRLEYVEDRSLLALQGPKAAAVLQSLVGGTAALDTGKLDFMFHVPGVTVGGVKDCYVTRCGYTGEDGFEISVPNAHAPALMQTILNVQPTLAAGLGARDSLRLEAGLCLYGHDLNESISPVEAALTWLIGKRRRTEGGYLGHDVISKQLGAAGVTRKRVGLAIKRGPPAREEAEIRTAAGERVGVVTSGTFSPCLKKPVSMGYVATAHSKVGTQLQVVVRGKPADAEVVAMPFVPSSYFKLPGAASPKKPAPKPAASA